MTQIQLKQSQKKAQSVYNAAADTFDDPANSYWERYGRRTVERLNLAPGSTVLDVRCGTGASALPAAEILNGTGHVIGLDLAENMLTLAHAKAQLRGLNNVEFWFGDMAQLAFEEGQFDAIVCVFAIFFVADMEMLIQELWRLLKPGGKLAITTWAPDLFQPMSRIFGQELGRHRPDLLPIYRPWHRLTTTTAVEELLRAGGCTNVRAEAERGRESLRDADSWWRIVLGSGLRGTVEAIGVDLAEQIRAENLRYIKTEGIQSVQTDVIYGVAEKLK
ncbi:methyltransferase domain-containing protein [Chloroflexi bacterium TSY]|nr:methyltransferase domain-containing protein [Chloroflexi bacterium TSY]